MKLLANLQEKENFIEVVYEGIKESTIRMVVKAPRMFREVHNHKAFVSVKLLDQHRVVKALVALHVETQRSND